MTPSRTAPWWNPVARWREWRRRKILAGPAPAAWRPWLERLPWWGRLSPDERGRLVDVARVLEAELLFEGCGGLAVTDEMRVTISAQAALLLLELDHDYFSNVPTILIYDGAFVDPLPRVDSAGVVHTGSTSLGEAWRRGPVVLSWSDVLAALAGGGRNLVLHEFAHKLDMLDGFADGRPPLESSGERKRWHDVMLREYEKLCEESSRGVATLLDAYGTTNPAEFFAVATETFFGLPRALRDRHPEMYALLADYYGQNPARRVEAAG